MKIGDIRMVTASLKVRKQGNPNFYVQLKQGAKNLLSVVRIQIFMYS